MDQHRRSALLAADLAGARVDISEAAKALACLRHAARGEDFFAYLRTVVRDGRAVIRSNQTLDYYRNLLAACERHLSGMDVAEMRQTLGWAIRLLRYYRAFPNAVVARAPAGSPPARHEQRPATRPATPEAQTATAAPPPVESTRPTGPRLPVAGDTFLGKVLQVDASAVLVEVPGFDAEKAIGVIKAEDLGGKRFNTGNMARVEVMNARTLKSGRTILELKPVAKKDQK